MTEFFVKLIEILANRKDKFKKADERYDRRIEFFRRVKEIDDDASLTPEIRKALLDSAAQKLTGSPRGGYEVVDYFIRNGKFINFEIIAPSVWFWDESIEKIYDENNKLVNIELNEKGYKKERRHLALSVFVMLMMTVFYILLGNKFINFISANFYINTFVLGIFFIGVILFFFGMAILMGVLFMTHIELPDLLKK